VRHKLSNQTFYEARVSINQTRHCRELPAFFDSPSALLLSVAAPYPPPYSPLCQRLTECRNVAIKDSMASGSQINHLDSSGKRRIQTSHVTRNGDPRTSGEKRTKSMITVSVGRIKCHGVSIKRFRNLRSTISGRACSNRQFLSQLFTPLGKFEYDAVSPVCRFSPAAGLGPGYSGPIPFDHCVFPEWFFELRCVVATRRGAAHAARTTCPLDARASARLRALRSRFYPRLFSVLGLCFFFFFFVVLFVSLFLSYSFPSTVSAMHAPVLFSTIPYLSPVQLYWCG